MLIWWYMKRNLPFVFIISVRLRVILTIDNEIYYNGKLAMVLNGEKFENGNEPFLYVWMSYVPSGGVFLRCWHHLFPMFQSVQNGITKDAAHTFWVIISCYNSLNKLWRGYEDSPLFVILAFRLYVQTKRKYVIPVSRFSLDGNTYENMGNVQVCNF